MARETDAMGDKPTAKALRTGRLGRFVSMARAGLGTATSVLTSSGGGLEKAVGQLAFKLQLRHRRKKAVQRAVGPRRAEIFRLSAERAPAVRDGD